MQVHDHNLQAAQPVPLRTLAVLLLLCPSARSLAMHCYRRCDVQTMRPKGQYHRLGAHALISQRLAALVQDQIQLVAQYHGP
jgi:hypothetical protein